MTLEEYFDNEIKKAETEEYNIFDNTEVTYHRLAIRLLKMLKEEILEVPREVTLREVKEECEKHREGCGDCVLLCEPTYSSPYYCEVGGMPARWNIDRIEKKMKEDIKQFNRGQNKTNE